MSFWVRFEPLISGIRQDKPAWDSRGEAYVDLCATFGGGHTPGLSSLPTCSK
jgi:hypothetical protein